MNDLELAQKLASLAKKRGADEAECLVERGRHASVKVRDGVIEDLTQATNKGAGLRVIVGARLGFATTTDFDEGGLDMFVARALAAAKESAPDERNALPTTKMRGTHPAAAALGVHWDPAVAEIDPAWKIAAAREMDSAARAEDPRIRKMDGASAGESVDAFAIASTRGLAAQHRTTSIWLSCSPVAEADGQLQTSYWMDVKRSRAALDSPESVGRKSAQRAARMLGARQVKSCKVPVVFDPQMAASFVGGLVGAVNGDLAFKKASFLWNQLNQLVASPLVTLTDDGLRKNGLGTAPFDGEGVAQRCTPIFERGVLRNFLYDTTTARKADAHSTGNAARGYASLPSIGTTNLTLAAGTTPPAELLRGLKRGFLVTAMLGRGANTVTGDYSRGANGLWIENGECTYAVHEVTVAGSLLQMLAAIDAVGDDLDFRGSTGAPSIRFAELAVSGS